MELAFRATADNKDIDYATKIQIPDGSAEDECVLALFSDDALVEIPSLSVKEYRIYLEAKEAHGRGGAAGGASSTNRMVFEAQKKTT